MSDKAGLIPYFIDGHDVLWFAFMTSSDPRFGGSAPMIAKGDIDVGETPDEAAVREAEEELGLRKDNMEVSTFERIWTGELTGMTEHYKFHVFMVQVKSMLDFDKPHYETEAVHWMTPLEFEKHGRSTQKHIVNHAVNRVRKVHKDVRT
jgi:8-oxo-dGTP pyrophosphatase MutT (NUDIX family)